jgi:hypothetical protein
MKLCKRHCRLQRHDEVLATGKLPGLKPLQAGQSRLP